MKTLQGSRNAANHARQHSNSRVPREEFDFTPPAVRKHRRRLESYLIATEL